MWRRPTSYLDTVGLLSEAEETAGELAYGKQKQLELAIALAEKPGRAAAGRTHRRHVTNGNRGTRSSWLTASPKERGLTLLFTEHDMGVVFGISDRIFGPASWRNHRQRIARRRTE